MLLVFIQSFMFLSCRLDNTRLSNHEVENVCFSTDIMPIIDKNCNSVGCHIEPNVTPKLSPAATAYKDLINSELIDLSDPSNSEFYKRMTEVSNPDSIQCPKDSNLSVIILKWIKEGAKDN